MSTEKSGFLNLVTREVCFESVDVMWCVCVCVRVYRMLNIYVYVYI